MSTLQKRLIIGIAVISVLTLLVVQHQIQVKLREENQSSRQRVDQLSNLVAQTELLETFSIERSPSPRVPAPPIGAAAPPVGSPSPQSNTVLDRILRGYPFPPKVHTEQIEAYLKENQRSAASLLAGSRVTKDQTLLQEAMEKYPHDPQVAFAAVFKKDATPEERRQWLDAFKRSAPENALANYLSAHEFFESGQIDQAIQELNAASGKTQLQVYFMDFDQNEEEAWGAAGYSTAEAKIFSQWSLLYPHVGELEQLSRDMVSLANAYRQGGDESSAQAALQMIVSLGVRLDESLDHPFASRKTRLDIERIALQAMDPTSSYGGTGQTVNDRLKELARKREVLNELDEQGDQFALRQKVSDQDWITYKDRCWAFGEEAAMQWLVGKYGQK